MLSGEAKSHCFFFCKESIEDVSHFFLDCAEFRDNFESVPFQSSNRTTPEFLSPQKP